MNLGRHAMPMPAAAMLVIGSRPFVLATTRAAGATRGSQSTSGTFDRSRLMAMSACPAHPPSKLGVPCWGEIGIRGVQPERDGAEATLDDVERWLESS